MLEIVLTTILIGPTIRESDGLAMSSRNTYLNSHERSIGPILYNALTSAKLAYQNKREVIEIYFNDICLFIEQKRPLQDIVQIAKTTIESQKEVKIDYINICDMETGQDLVYGNAADVKEISQPSRNSKQLMMSGAIIVGKTRLIDNILLD